MLPFRQEPHTCSPPFQLLCAAGMLLVDVELKTLRRPAPLHEFLDLQDLHIGDVTDALRSDWVLKVVYSPWHATA